MDMNKTMINFNKSKGPPTD